MAISLLQIAYMLSVKPLKQDNRIEVQNEVVVYISCVLYSNLLDVRMSNYIRGNTGWFLIGICGIGITYNVLLTIIRSFSECIIETKQNKLMRRRLIIIKS